MAEGFPCIQGLKEMGMTSQAAFSKVFAGDWKASAFGDHNHVQVNTPAGIMLAERKGRQLGGKWSKLTVYSK
jgi:hypothetical protein